MAIETCVAGTVASDLRSKKTAGMGCTNQPNMESVSVYRQNINIE